MIQQLKDFLLFYHDWYYPGKNARRVIELFLIASGIAFGIYLLFGKLLNETLLIGILI